MKKIIVVFLYFISTQVSSQCYSVNSITYSPDSFNSGVPVQFVNWDAFSDVIQIPFSVCFFGNVYNQVVVGDNGVVSFDTSYANNFCSWIISHIPYSPSLRNSVFVAWQDLAPQIFGNVSYAVYGNAPNRRFVVSYDSIAMFNQAGTCTGQYFTGQTKIFETSNVIEIHIRHKEVCISWNSGQAVEGIQNAVGNTASEIPGRNSTQWSAYNDAWSFVPNCCPLGLGISLNQPAIILSPNPANDFLEIKKVPVKTPIRILNLFGQEILRSEISEFDSKIDVRFLADGVYFLELDNGGIYKFLVAH